MAVLADDLGTGRNVQEVNFQSTREMLSLEFGLSERAAVEILNRCGAGFDEPVSRENFSKIFMALRFQLSSSKFEEDDIDEYNETRNDHQRRGEYFEVVSSKFIVRKLRRIFNYRLNNDVTYLDAFVIASLTLALIYILFNLNFESTNYFLNEDKLEDSSLGINILTYLFILELACKCFAFGATRYFDDLWNLFEPVSFLSHAQTLPSSNSNRLQLLN